MKYEKVLNKLQKVYDRYNGKSGTDQYEMPLLKIILERGTIEDENISTAYTTYDNDMELLTSWFDWYDGNPLTH